MSADQWEEIARVKIERVDTGGQFSFRARIPDLGSNQGLSGEGDVTITAALRSLADAMRGRLRSPLTSLRETPHKPKRRRPTMATTIEDIKNSMAEAADEHGYHSRLTLEHAETLEQVFDDIENLGDHRGESARWGSHDHFVYRLACGSLVGVQYYNATESRDSFYEGSVGLKEKSVVTYVPSAS